MSKEEDPTTVNGMMAAMKQNSDGTNVLKESIKTFSNPDGKDKKSDRIVGSTDDALSVLKQLIEKVKESTKKAKKKAKRDFKASPHEEFGKTLDDAFMSFIVWAKVKKQNEDEATMYNVSKAFRRVEAYAEFMDDSEDDLSKPALSADTVKEAIQGLAMTSSVEKDGQFVWWFDLKAIDKDLLKKKLKPVDSLRAFVWYAHFIMYNKTAQEKGMVVVENCGHMGFFELFGLFPMKLGTQIDRFTIGVIPVKCNKIYITEGSGWIKMFMKFMGMFMSKKMMQRIIFLEEWKEVPELLGEDCVPVKFGKLDGKMEIDIVHGEYFST
mmetsp:Transcript_6060/g.6591  ORF Transcript_6060/g.6591 Transcript_6060/m.6591 type:complete len:324 (-) Transcript_6060:368-1339(-)